MERILLKKWVVVLVMAVAVTISLRPASLQAAVVPAQTAAASGNVNQILDNPEIMSRLAALGYTRAEVRETLVSMTPAQRAGLEERVNLLARGGNGLGVIVVILVIVVFVALLLEASGHRLSIETKAGN